MGITPELHLSLIYLRGFSSFPLHVLQFYNLLERFFKFPLHVQHFYLRGFSSLPEVFTSFPLHNSTSFNLPRDLHFLSTILHSTKKHWFSLNISTLHNLQGATHTPK